MSARCTTLAQSAAVSLAHANLPGVQVRGSGVARILVQGGTRS